MPELTTEQALRYARQINLPQIDLEGQERLLAARVLVVGLGGLGCAAAQYLAAGGVGCLRLVDGDKVERSNLQRQILHRPDELDVPKVVSAGRRLSRLNPDMRLEAVETFVDEDNVASLMSEVDVVLDGCDNLATRKLVHRAARKLGVPLVSGAAIRWEGQWMVFRHQESEPCYECLTRFFGEQSLSCVEAGIMSPLVGIVGSLQALETMKLLLQLPALKPGTLGLFDGLRSEFRYFHLPRFADCPCCGQGQ